jgi:hypothetical protein
VGSGLQIGGGSTVIHNTADGNGVGLSIGCPSTVIVNTTVNNSTILQQQVVSRVWWKREVAHSSGW